MVTNDKQLYFFIGTTSEFIKLAGIFKELKKRKIKFTLITSGQNKINFERFSDFVIVKPSVTLSEKVNRPSMLSFLFWAIQTFIQAFLLVGREFKTVDRKNSLFIIHGDTVTSSIGAIIATFYGLKLVHIESGYFSFNLWEPFPEEICRKINSLLAKVRFAPTDWAARNLEKFKGITVSTKNNTIIETFWWAMNRRNSNQIIKKFGKYYLLFVHRQEHVIFKKDWTKNMMEFIIKNGDNDLTCVLLNHPLTTRITETLNLGTRAKKLKIIPPLTYPDFLALIKKSEFVISDGASLQQETYYMGKPLLILRDYTEQSEGLGKNAVLCRSDQNVIKNFLINYHKFTTLPIHPKISPAKIVVDYLVKN